MYLYLIFVQGKTIRCSLSETKNRLFIGNIPKSWTEDEFRKVIEDVGPGVENIELIKVTRFYHYSFGATVDLCLIPLLIITFLVPVGSNEFHS